MCRRGKQDRAAAGFWRCESESDRMERRVFNTDVKNGVEKKKVESLSRAIAEGFYGLHSGMCAARR